MHRGRTVPTCSVPRSESHDPRPHTKCAHLRGLALEFEPDKKFDFIIAHGFFSWVEDKVKLALMDFIRNHLSPTGIATVSFNVAAGWRERMPVVAKTRVIAAAGNVAEMTAIAILKTASEDDTEKLIIDDMLAKGAEVLAFDDFAPVMDAWSVGAFRNSRNHTDCDAWGIRFLGKSAAMSQTKRGRQPFTRKYYAEPMWRFLTILRKRHLKRPRITRCRPSRN